MLCSAVRSPLLLVFGLTACAAHPPDQAQQPKVDNSSAADTWSTQTWEDRHDTMTWGVLPNMARAFQELEGTALPEMSCFTCHGVDAERVSYAMPHGLPALDPAHMPRRDSANPKEAKFAAFMEDEVVPRLRHITEDPKVSCFSCHPKAGDK